MSILLRLRITFIKIRILIGLVIREIQLSVSVHFDQVGEVFYFLFYLDSFMGDLKSFLLSFELFDFLG